MGIRSKLKSKATYGLFVFVVIMFLANVIYKQIESYNDKLDKLDRLSKQVSYLKKKNKDLDSELEEYDLMLEEYDNDLDFYKNGITLRTEVPYKFIKNGEYEKYIYDYNRINTFNNTELLRAKVRISGAENIIDFSTDMNQSYRFYYALYLINENE